MSIHKLTAGSGYDYLTRQVAALDATDKGHVALADYYSARGEEPGRWVGSGMTGIDGLACGDPVTVQQMTNLFGSGHHPLAEQRLAGVLAQLEDRSKAEVAGRTGDADPGEVRNRTGSAELDEDQPHRLGKPFRVYSNDFSALRVEVARRCEQVNRDAGLPADWPIPRDERSRIRTQVAREFFVAEQGREPADARELAASIAKNTRPRTNAVAGYDLTFSPVKSVSTLWAVADRPVAEAIEAAHDAAVGDALSFIERRALFTRSGRDGVRQIDVRGLVAAAFTHRDSRAGDPDLHTHVAVANKVQALDGRWLAIDGRVLFKAVVAASETYNTALELHLERSLGLRFETRADAGPAGGRARPVREVVGVDPRLNQRWSSRRAMIESRRDDLAVEFQLVHGRPPSPVESLQLAQQATLETRQRKHEPRSLSEQRAVWREQAIEVLATAPGAQDGPTALRQMVTSALSPTPGTAAPVPGTAWFEAVAQRVMSAMESSRATWQDWHARAEALRQVRAADTTEMSIEQVNHLVDLLVDDVLTNRSHAITEPTASTSISGRAAVPAPTALRRRDGSSVYTVAGSTLFTSARVVQAERRLVEAAGRTDGALTSESDVAHAIRRAAATGTPLNPGQVELVRQMATSGRRVHLGIAPAGSGKTTAMSALTDAWCQTPGRTVVGLAPSAAAAGQLRDAISGTAGPDRARGSGGPTSDTLAKLVHSIETGDLPAWAGRIDRGTLVVVDEAGMADTLSLDTAVRFALDRGASVRLIGDDQQLAAIGAGGVLRDIKTTHGAAHLSELMRFTSAAEAAASLALRVGDPAALGFYLDNARVHVGGHAAATDDIYEAWKADRAAGLDAVMLAPTRELVAELNHRARTDRLTNEPDHGPTATAALADGNVASAGDVVITRQNDRRLRVSSTDWVKNGDRWVIQAVDEERGPLGRAVRVRHTQSGLVATLPASYVTSSVELGYATTVHTAQGVSVDTMHGLVSGAEDRQQLYTMLTRGRTANHVYVDMVIDGDPHSVIHPETIHPATATDVLERILAVDAAPRSATTQAREHHDPALRLGQAVNEYADALYVAAEAIAVDEIDRLADLAEDLVLGLTRSETWPTLRAHLMLISCHGDDPAARLREAVSRTDLAGVRDTAAVIEWRLDESGMRSSTPGPLPWLPAIPDRLLHHPEWGRYLDAAVAELAALSTQVRSNAVHDPANAAGASHLPPAVANDLDLVADVALWRAATSTPPGDSRPTGPPQPSRAARAQQRALDRRIGTTENLAWREWGPSLLDVSGIGPSGTTTRIAERLAAASRTGLDAAALLNQAAATGPLPDDHAADALWWRLTGLISPALIARFDHESRTPAAPAWQDTLDEFIGRDRAARLRTSPAWPALTAIVDDALQQGWQLTALFPECEVLDPAALDEAETLLWRTAAALVPHDHRDQTEDHPEALPPADLEQADPQRAPDTPIPVEERDLDFELHIRALARTAAPVSAGEAKQPTQREILDIYDRIVELELSPVPETRLLELNEKAARFFADQLQDSWAQQHLIDRLCVDITGHPHIRPGYAPASWTALTDHLRRHGATAEELLAAGLSTTTRNDRLIDRFRDRLVFPITRPTPTGAEVVGFVGRCRPGADDPANDHPAPKYLNTPQTLLYRKSELLFGLDHAAPAAVPVVVEGPIDAIAITIASRGAHVGTAALGTAFTASHAAQLAKHSHENPLIATDPDTAGQVSGERAFWHLAARGLTPSYVHLPRDLDPASLLADRGPSALQAALAAHRPYADHLLDDVVAASSAEHVLRTLATTPPEYWQPQLERAARLTGTGSFDLRCLLLAAIDRWDDDPTRHAGLAIGSLDESRRQIEASRALPAAERWAPHAEQADPRLTQASDWPATAAALQAIHDDGIDARVALRTTVAETALGAEPSRELRYRLAELSHPGSEKPRLESTGHNSWDEPEPDLSAQNSAERDRAQIRSHDRSVEVTTNSPEMR